MNNIYKNVVFSLILFTSFISFSQSKRSINATIKVENNNKELSIVAMISNATSKTIKDLKYELSVERISKTNNVSHTKQSGMFVLKPNSNIQLSKQYINTDVGTPTFLHLVIKKQGIVVAKEYKKVVLKKTNNKLYLDIAYVQPNGKRIIQESKSIIGGDFCTFFKETNGFKGITYPFDVVVKEQAVQDSSTEMSIYANKDLIYKFRYLDKKQYLKAAVQEINKRLLRYHLYGSLYSGNIDY